MNNVDTVGKLLHLSYANLASVDAAQSRGLPVRDRACWAVRQRLYAGLRSGKMRVRSLFADAMEMPADRCVYCGTEPPPKLTADHLIPKHRGGLDSADNLVWACRSCNSSKHSQDLLEWYAARQAFPSVLLMRRYLKLALAEAEALGAMDTLLVASPPVTFSVDYIPLDYPEPSAAGVLVRRVATPA